MKQLKFMLAAATAVGFAAAAKSAPVNENFNDYTIDMIGAAITNVVYDSNNQTLISGIPGFSFEGTEGDNESAIVADGVNDMALKVNTGTDPLLCQLDIGSTVDLTEENLESLNINTKVKFTVTPFADIDNVKPKASDKLMIYLQEDLSEGQEPATNLVIWAAGEEDSTITAKPYVVPSSSLSVEPDKWYQLNVVASKLAYENAEAFYPCFKIYLAEEGETLQHIKCPAESITPFAELDEYMDYFPSLALIGAEDGLKSASLTYVGFAGEGTVDDLVVTKSYLATSIDFTFTGENLSSVTYTIGATTNTWEVGDEATVLAAEATITIESIAFSGLYKVADNSAVKVGSELTVDAAGMEFAVSSTALTGESDAKVPANTKPADIGIESTTGIPATVPSTTLDNMIKWASANKGTSTAIATINTIKFDEDGNPAVEENGSVTNLPAQAFLLNCTVDQVETVKDAFKFTALTFTNGKPNLNGVATSWQEGSTFNGVPALDGKKELDDNWSTGEAIPSDAKFFRARLVLPGFNQ